VTPGDTLAERLAARSRYWLVTGSAGFIGSHLLQNLLAAGQLVTSLDDFSTGHRANLDDVRQAVGEAAWSRHRFIEGDIADLATCEAVCSGVDIVLHQAALGSVPRSISEPLRTHRANADGFLNMLDAARRAGVGRFVYAASSSTYGDSPTLPKVEHQIGRPLSPYAVTKYLNELYADVYGRCYGIATVGLRYFNVFGPHEAKKGRAASMIYHLARQIASGKRPRLFTDGSQKRDHIYVKDCVRANLLAMTAPSGVYNVGTGIGTSFNELVFHIGKALGVTPDIDYIDNPYTGTYQDDTCADPMLARERLGFVAIHDVATAIPEYVAFLRETGEL
jgi:UDP-N-acetylglucosamine 4-epimerase